MTRTRGYHKKMSWTEEVKVDVLKLGATLHMQNEPLFLLV